MPEVTIEEAEQLTIRETNAATLVGMSRNNLREIARLGHHSPPEDGVYNLIEVFRGVIAHYKAMRSGKGDIEREKLRTERLKGDIYELDRDARRGRLIPIKSVEETWDDAILHFRGKMLALADRVAPLVVQLGTVEEVSRMISKEVNEALLELSGVSYKTEADFVAPDEVLPDVGALVPTPGGLKEEVTDEASDEKGSSRRPSTREGESPENAAAATTAEATGTGAVHPSS